MVRQERRSGALCLTAPFDRPKIVQRAENVVDRTQKREPVMARISSAVVSFLKDESGPTAVEYAVMLALIIVVCITSITVLGSNASSTFSNVALNGAAGGKGS
jgi:pilus assembly protein Flp/PilA